MTRNCSGRGMDQIQSQFSGDACVRFVANRHRQKTYAAIIRELGLALSLRQCQPHSVILASLLLRKHLQKSSIDVTILEVCHAQLELKTLQETKASFE